VSAPIRRSAIASRYQLLDNAMAAAVALAAWMGTVESRRAEQTNWLWGLWACRHRQTHALALLPGSTRTVQAEQHALGNGILAPLLIAAPRISALSPFPCSARRRMGQPFVPLPPMPSSSHVRRILVAIGLAESAVFGGGEREQQIERYPCREHVYVTTSEVSFGQLTPAAVDLQAACLDDGFKAVIYSGYVMWMHSSVDGRLFLSKCVVHETMKLICCWRSTSGTSSIGCRGTRPRWGAGTTCWRQSLASKWLAESLVTARTQVQCELIDGCSCQSHAFRQFCTY
jgi:hypothetical protein